jgi:transcription elongation GreA/GreB family factor
MTASVQEPLTQSTTTVTPSVTSQDDYHRMTAVIRWLERLGNDGARLNVAAALAQQQRAERQVDELAARLAKVDDKASSVAA